MSEATPRTDAVVAVLNPKQVAVFLKNHAETLERELSAAEANLHNPDLWMKWCDNRVLERCEAAEARLVAVEAELKLAQGLLRDCESYFAWKKVKRGLLEQIRAALRALGQESVKAEEGGEG